MAEQNSTSASPNPAADDGITASIQTKLADLQELKRLRQKGELSQAEFDYFQHRLLSSLPQVKDEDAMPTPHTPAAALADASAPQGVPYDNRLSIFAERPPQDARKLQKT